MNLNQILKAFNIEDVKDIEALKGGNINNTYLVKDDFNNSFVLQKINKYVFKKPEDVMANIILVTLHLKEKNVNTLEFLKSKDDLYFYKDERNDYYRCYKYVPNARTYPNTNNLEVIEEAGRAFGKFQNALSDLDGSKLYEVIKNFHNTASRLNDLENTIKCGSDRYEEVKDEIESLKSLTDYSVIVNSLKDGSIPLRITHNDTKVDNVLFNVFTKKSICVIDFDTIMPGSFLYDYGDSVRSICSTSSEDEEDPTITYLDMNKFKALTKGFLKETKSMLNKKEIELMPLSVLILTAELSMRFYEDYLNHDKYFKIQYTNHNLVRARCILSLAKDIKSKLGLMKEYIDSIINI